MPVRYNGIPVKVDDMQSTLLSVSARYKDSLSEKREKDHLLAKFGMKIQSLKKNSQKMKDASEFLDMRIWLDDMFSMGNFKQKKLASITKPSFTSNTAKNRPIIKKWISLCISLDIMQEVGGKKGLYSHLTRSQALNKLDTYQHDKITIDAKVKK
jgi:hypothetical protein